MALELKPSGNPADLPPVLIPGEIIPPAVKEMGSLADRLQAEHIARLNGELAPETAVVESVVVPPMEPTPVVVAPAGNEPLPAPATPGTEGAKWEHAYKSAKGRFDANTHRLQGVIDGQAAEIRRLQSTPAPQQPAPVALAPTGPLDLAAAGISAEDIEAFGPEIFAAVDKIATARVNAVVAGLTPKMDGIAQSVQMDAELRMGSVLNQQLAAATGGQVDFDQINQDQNFIAWLDLPDVMSGVKRGDLLLDAWNSRNGSRVLSICTAYLGEHARTAPVPVVPTVPTTPAVIPVATPVATPQAAPKIPLASLAAPGRARAQAPATPAPDKPIYSGAEVKAFYAAKQKGFYTPEDAQKWEREIIAAGAEGRIQG